MKNIYVYFIFMSLSSFSELKANTFFENKDIQKTICSKNLIANKWEHGYTWTITSRLGQALNIVQTKYGKRNQDWTILGIEFSTKKQPQIWYPGSFEGRKDVIIQLTKSTSCNIKQALFQVSHEVVHLLSPNGKQNKTSVLEEGIATYFSIYYLNFIGFNLDPSQYINLDKYKKAYEAVNNLYELYQDTDIRIQNLRKDNNQSLSENNLSVNLIKKHFPNINIEIARYLASNFYSSK